MLIRACPWCHRIGRATARCCLPDPPRSLIERSIPGVDRALAAHSYDAVVRRLVLAAKNGGRRDVAEVLGRRLARALGTAAGSADLGPHLGLRPTVVWVPASRHGRRVRGYDQARVMARAVARELDLPLMPLLARVGEHAQAGRRREERLDGPGIRSRLRCGPSRILLVDDVMTTGASLEAAARVLRGAGAVAVMAATVASSHRSDDRLVIVTGSRPTGPVRGDVGLWQ